MQPHYRLFTCNGTAQLVSLSVAATVDKSFLSGTHDLLAIHNLQCPLEQRAEFSSVIKRCAARLGNWSAILDLTEFDKAHTSEICQLIGQQIPHVDTLFLNYVQCPSTIDFRGLYPNAETVSYGDGLGLHFSSQYFQPTPPRTLSTIYKKLILRKVMNRTQPVGFDRLCLLFPGIFDEPAPPHELMHADDFHSRFDQLLDEFSEQIVFRLNRLGCFAEMSEEIVFMLTTNFSESKKMTLDDELAAIRQYLSQLKIASTSTIIIKPHPRDSRTKLQQVASMLRQIYQNVQVFDDPLLFYLPFESIIAHFSATDKQRLRCVCFSSACLGLQHIMKVKCHIGFGPELIKRHFDKRWITHRLQHESDLQQAMTGSRDATAASH